MSTSSPKSGSPRSKKSKKPRKPTPQKDSSREPKPSFQGIALLAEAILLERLDLARDAYALLRLDLNLPGDPFLASVHAAKRGA